MTVKQPDNDGKTFPWLEFELETAESRRHYVVLEPLPEDLRQHLTDVSKWARKKKVSASDAVSRMCRRYVNDVMHTSASTPNTTRNPPPLPLEGFTKLVSTRITFEDIVREQNFTHPIQWGVVHSARYAPIGFADFNTYVIVARCTYDTEFLRGIHDFTDDYDPEELDRTIESLVTMENRLTNELFDAFIRGKPHGR